jgi:hypothetical protein
MRRLAVARGSKLAFGSATNRSTGAAFSKLGRFDLKRVPDTFIALSVQGLSIVHMP